MSSPPPTKPPRGVKQGKETSGLLMSVIRTLSASETNEQREKERAKLEKEYKKSDARLDELVAAHSQEITEVMQELFHTHKSIIKIALRYYVTGSHLLAAADMGGVSLAPSSRIVKIFSSNCIPTSIVHHFPIQIETKTVDIEFYGIARFPNVLLLY
ncbi:unnamed protein product [Parnassius apollo]|uniref:(apollo) hypothetical protein n=1 Tax=Parnassius apollo TaxID=110799 RepID=A0A8S3XA61_PARAO|nr:unnamed protein product [Parnassius apollo]